MKNFVGVFPANHMNKFIGFKSMITENTGKYPFLTESGPYLTLNQTLTYFVLFSCN